MIINGGAFPTSEGVETATEGGKEQSTPVTTSTNPTSLHILRQKPRTHLNQTQRNTRGTTPLIIIEEPATRRSQQLNLEAHVALQPTSKPNSAHIPLHQLNIITQAAVDALTANIYYSANEAC